MPAALGTPAGITPEISWPVAPVPAEALPTVCGGVLLKPRWPFRGDLRLVVIGTGPDADVYVSADDIVALVAPAGAVTLVTSPSDVWAHRPGSPCMVVFTLAEAVTVLEDECPADSSAHELLSWLEEQLPIMRQDDVLDSAVRAEDFLNAFPIAQAARILDRDPAISMGRTRLFAHLDRLGWVTRALAGGHWEATREPLREGWLATHDVIIRRVPLETYRQLYVTRDGLAELRRSLYALNDQAPDAPAPETLSI